MSAADRLKARSLALQQQRAAGGTKLTERSTTNERLARRKAALQTHFSVDDPNDSGGVFLSAEDAEQLRQRSPVVASPQSQPPTTQGRLARRRFDDGGELASNAIGVAQIRQARRDRAAGLPPPSVGAAEAAAPIEGAAKLTQRAKMLREQRQQVPLSERKTTNAEAEQRAALRKEAYAQFTEGGGSVFMSDGAVPQELLEARKMAEERENEAKERRRAVLATFSANDAHVFLHDHNIPRAMRGDDVPPSPLRERAESDLPGASPTSSPAVSDRGGARQRLRRRLSSTASSNGSGGGGAGSVAERAKAMRMARQQRGGGEVTQMPPASPLASSRSIAVRTQSGSSSPAVLAHTVAMQRAERQLKEDAERQRIDAEAEEHEVEEALRSTRQELATVSRELLDH